MDKSPLISVIIPVYNVENFIEKCLDSIINQTYKNLEIICINDGSKDSSLEILQKYAQNDERIKLVNQENKGLGATRNVGLGIATGEFVSFIDSDDYVDKNLYQNCINVISKDTDVVVYGAKTVNLKNNKIYKGQYTSDKFNKTFNLNNLYNIYPVAWNKLYRHSLLKENNIIFDTPKTAEDQTFFIKVVLNSKKISILKEDLYYYIKYRNGALSRRKDCTDLSSVENTYNILNYLKIKEISPDIKNKIVTRFLLKSLSWYSKIDKNEQPKIFQNIVDLLNTVKNNNGKYWWSYYKLNPSSNYYSMKIEYYLSVLRYKISK